MHPKMPSAKWRSFCPGEDGLVSHPCSDLLLPLIIIIMQICSMAMNILNTYGERFKGRALMLVVYILSRERLRCCSFSWFPSLFSLQYVGLYVLNWPLEFM